MIFVWICLTCATIWDTKAAFFAPHSQRGILVDPRNNQLLYSWHAFQIPGAFCNSTGGVILKKNVSPITAKTKPENINSVLCFIPSIIPIASCIRTDAFRFLFIHLVLIFRIIHERRHLAECVYRSPVTVFGISCLLGDPFLTFCFKVLLPTLFLMQFDISSWLRISHQISKIWEKIALP